MRCAAPGGFGPSWARPQLAPLDGAALVVAIASVAALAALDFQEAQMPLRIAALGGFEPSQARPQQALFEGGCPGGDAGICCSISCFGPSADPGWGRPGGCNLLEDRSPGRFRTLPGKTSASPI